MKQTTGLHRTRRRRTTAIAATAMAAVVLLILLIGRQREKPFTIPGPACPDTITAHTADTVVPRLVQTDTSAVPAPVARNKKRHIAPVAQVDTAAPSTVAQIPQTAEVLHPRTTPCDQDTVAVWVYPEPSGGLHHGPVTIRFHENKPSTINWQRATDTTWQVYHGESLFFDTSVVILFNAVDSCGNEMPTREELYEIEPASKSTACPSDMELVKIGSLRFCIDRYEWPNRKGVRPTAYVSLFQAEDSCFSVNKRLCTSEEWTLACSGPYSWNYPYGQEYEINACVTSDTAPWPSGMRPECRAYFGVFDMSGNLAEWTSTKAKGNRDFYNVMGGFWESGPRSGCREVRYSYFPQNRHNPVGFRCCADAAGNDRDEGAP